jgi:hypothetical protein
VDAATRTLVNLALACHRCNLKKGTNLTGVDPVSGELVRLFHPRQDRWEEHFLVEGVRIEGRTPVGRATVRVLAMNDARRWSCAGNYQSIWPFDAQTAQTNLLQPLS